MTTDDVFNDIQRKIDDAIDPRRMTAEAALEVLDQLVEYCASAADGLREDMR